MTVTGCLKIRYNFHNYHCVFLWMIAVHSLRTVDDMYLGVLLMKNDDYARQRLYRRQCAQHDGNSKRRRWAAGGRRGLAAARTVHQLRSLQRHLPILDVFGISPFPVTMRDKQGTVAWFLSISVQTDQSWKSGRHWQFLEITKRLNFLGSYRSVIGDHTQRFTGLSIIPLQWW